MDRLSQRAEAEKLVPSGTQGIAPSGLGQRAIQIWPCMMLKQIAWHVVIFLSAMT